MSNNKNLTTYSNRFPLISCLCVTHRKPHFLLRAINCFEQQDYPNKELIIVYEADDQATSGFLQGLRPTFHIHLVCISKHKKLTLGELRNISIANANGAFLCQWDDDDWYSPIRLSVQYDVIVRSGKKGSILTKWLLFNYDNNFAYISNNRPWEGSLLCEKQSMKQIGYISANKGEDTPMIDGLIAMKILNFIPDRPELYVYTYNGYNTWDEKHFSSIFACSQKLGIKDSEIIKDIMINGKNKEIELSVLPETIHNQKV
ncbi:glycosyltransferase [Pedobacter sp. GR22-10]|uniref:glycosyltransferase n=1 Tax=Pedobacter sp. GR22-10 TaxID=2994472 RepID=UPI0022466529|nr:glycosyltransferase [Pedobacter sp. GR22-10]MCX2431616.1 glycosyltransferase [Pedobacter sp. GR22-10]